DGPETAGGTSGSPDSDVPNPSDAASRLAQEVKAVFRTHCYRCHGENGAAEGGFNFILDRDRLVARRKVIPGDAERSRVSQRGQQGERRPEEEKPRPGPKEVAFLKRWIEAGAPDIAPPTTREVSSATPRSRLRSALTSGACRNET